MRSAIRLRIGAAVIATCAALAASLVQAQQAGTIKLGIVTFLSGAAAGPFVVINLVGSRVVLHAQSNLTALGRFYAPAASVVRVGEQAGTWEIGDPSPPDAARDKAVADRLMGAAFLALLQELDEDVAAPADIDLGARHAFKFGKPPCGLMDGLGREEVERLLRPFCDAYGAALPDSLARVGRLTGQG